MPRILLAVLVGVALAAAGCGQDDGDGGEGSPGFDAERALADVEHLAATIGARPTGSDGAATAADYIAGEFAKAHFGVFRQNFSFETDPNRTAAVAVGATSLPATTAGGSAAGRASGVAADVGTAESADAGSLTGKVALARRGGSTFRQKHDAAWKAGAVALVIINGEPGELIADLGESARIPVVTVTSPVGADLLFAAANAAPVTVEVPPARTAEGTNIAARATSAHACVYVIAANYDSLPGSEGANDNASGVAVLLELARQFATRDEVPAVCLVAFDAGFLGGMGAERYVASVGVASRPAAVITLRAVGGDGRLTASGDAALARDAGAVADDLGVRLTLAGATAPSTSMSAAFRALGIPTLDILRDAGPSPDDGPKRIERSKLGEAGRLAAELMTRLSAIAAR